MFFRYTRDGGDVGLKQIILIDGVTKSDVNESDTENKIWYSIAKVECNNLSYHTV